MRLKERMTSGDEFCAADDAIVNARMGRMRLIMWRSELIMDVIL